MHRMDVAERRRRLALRHCLAPGGGEAPGRPASWLPAAGPADVARRLVALHSTDPATVYLSIRARMAHGVTPAVIEESLYERRDLVRMLAMRRTVFVVPVESVPVVQAAATHRVGQDQRARLLKLLADTGAVDDPGPWLADVERSVLRALEGMGGTATAAELSAAEPRLKTTLMLAEGKTYQASTAITSRVLLVLAAQGRLVRGRPIGSWLSQQYRWTLAEHWLPAPSAKAAVSETAARTELARLWLSAFGPAPLSDLKWWTGWSMTQARQAVSGLAVAEVDLGNGSGLALADDLDHSADPGDWVALLPALDPTVMGWSERSWFLSPHGGALFDTNGNAGPTIWVNGQVVGGWAQRADGEIAIRLLADVGADATEQIEAEAGRLGTWLGASRVIPRFRTPTERELSA